MQFFVIHEDPVVNAEILPDYCIKRVNVREGWQMISDICHAHGVIFDGQNKEYNRYHPNTWRWWKDQEKFHDFIKYYFWCLYEYEKRFNKKTLFHKKFFDNYKIIVDVIHKINNMNEHESMIHYMIERKSHLLTDEEIKKLKGEQL